MRSTLTTLYILTALVLLLYGAYCLVADIVTSGLIALIIGFILVVLAFINLRRGGGVRA